MQYKHEYGMELEKLISTIGHNKNKNLMREFLFDILSPSEYRELAVRWQIIKMLKSNAPHRDIAKKLKTSVATVTRGSRELGNKKGGFNQVWALFYS